MTFWTYILRCSDGRYYVGHTDDLAHRIGQHENGTACDYTARRQPIEAVWSQDFPSRYEALAAERQIKGWGRAKKEALIAGDWAAISRLAASPGARPSTMLRTNGAAGTTGGVNLP
jgi:predicted GIY-YIG superfamily endonuclease